MPAAPHSVENWYDKQKKRSVGLSQLTFSNNKLFFKESGVVVAGGVSRIAVVTVFAEIVTEGW